MLQLCCRIISINPDISLEKSIFSQASLKLKKVK